jgi:hypothetical protein
VQRLALDYDEAGRENIIQTLRTQMLTNVVNVALDRKLRERIVAIATGSAPALAAPADEAPADEAPAPADEAPADEAPAAEA